jgi:hypothetical protein
VNGFRRDAIIVFQDSPHPHAGGEQIALGADGSADEIDGLFDSFRRVDEDEAVTEAPVRKNRDRAERKIAIARCDVS